jgi:aminoglycoside phosphotransferase (APT) family kinase protein
MITVNTQLELFKKNFPKEKILSVQERHGTDHQIIEINHTWMCKSSKKKENIPALAREFKLLSILQDKITTTKIPVPLYYEENFLVYKKIPGSPLISYTFYRLGNKQKTKLIFEIAHFLYELHSALNSEEIKSLELVKTDWPWSLEKLETYQPHISANADMLEIFDTIIQMYKDAIEEPLKQTLIHNNMNLKNIIIDPLQGQLRGIIDFSDAALDDYGFDLRMRHDSPIELVTGISLAYATISNVLVSPEKVYGYYFATELSRYFQHIENNNIEESKKTMYAMIKSMHSLLISHDICKDGNSCVHSELQHQPTQIEATL